MKKISHWIKHHQITAFFLITFAITWGLGFSYNAAINNDAFLLYPVASLATCGPALSGIIITAVSSSQPKEGKKRTWWIAFFTAWIAVTTVALTHNTYINKAPLSIPLVILFFIMEAPVAYVISMAFSRLPAVKKYLSTLFRVRGTWSWSLFAFAVTPVSILLSFLISGFLHGQPFKMPMYPETGFAFVGLIVIKFFYQFFFYNATGEEIGWRGFALPRLLLRSNPLVASLVIGVFWLPWHFFLWNAQGTTITWDTNMINSIILVFISSIIQGWFYHRSKGSILVAGILHASGNTWIKPLLNADWEAYILVKAAIALVFILADRMWVKLPPDHPSVYQTPVPMKRNKPFAGEMAST